MAASKKKAPFPYVLKPTEANQARVKEVLRLDLRFPQTDLNFLLPHLCAKPLLRAVVHWRINLYRSGLSPFALSALAGVSLERTLKQLSAEGWLQKLYYCVTTNLPVCHWNTGLEWPKVFLSNPPSARKLVDGYAPTNRLYKPPISFASLAAKAKKTKEMRKFSAPGHPSPISAADWKELEGVVRLREK